MCEEFTWRTDQIRQAVHGVVELLATWVERPMTFEEW